MNDTSMLPPVHPSCRCIVYYTHEEPNVSVEPVPQTTTTVVEEPTEETVEEEIISSDSNSMLKGKPTVYTEKDIVNGSKVTVYKYENGFEIAVNENAVLSHEEIVSHINSLPDALKNLPELKRINIKDWQSSNAGGEYRVAYQDINLYAYPDSSKVTKLDTLTHELAHARDFNGTLVNNLSLKEIYEKIFKADNKLYTYVKPNGRKRTPKKFPTDYAARSFVKYGKDFKKRLKIWENGTKTVPKPSDKTFAEDFAESSKLYLNPTTHDQFVKDFPNRAEYLESIYGEPKFDKNSPLYKALNEEGVI